MSFLFPLKTVKTHVSNILSKLEVSDRTQAVVYAFQHHVPQEIFNGIIERLRLDKEIWTQN